jgi:hypothetical protein
VPNPGRTCGPEVPRRFGSENVSYGWSAEMGPGSKGSKGRREWSKFFSGVVETTRFRSVAAWQIASAEGNGAVTNSRALRHQSLARGSPPFRGDGRRTRIALTPTGRTRCESSVRNTVIARLMPGTRRADRSAKLAGRKQDRRFRWERAATRALRNFRANEAP